jgi:phosphonate transport system permease protein
MTTTQPIALYRARPRSRFLTISLWLMAGSMIGVWLCTDLSLSALWQPREKSHLSRFLTDITPYPLVEHGWSWSALWGWLRDTLNTRFETAVLPTVALSVVSVSVAAACGLVLSVGAARRLPGGQSWAVFGGACRALLLVMRAIPTYLWAYLLVLIFGLGAWPAVIALALHNTGTLGRMAAEIIDNLEPGVPRAFQALGASRAQTATLAAFPQGFGRFLLFFFVRWETAVREATVLGLLGFVSIGWFIADARARMQTDVMMLFILLASALIIAGDAMSVIVRQSLRQR